MRLVFVSTFITCLVVGLLLVIHSVVEVYCRTSWNDSGLQWRVKYFSCQVQVKDNWVPASNVRLDQKGGSDVKSTR